MKHYNPEIFRKMAELIGTSFYFSSHTALRDAAYILDKENWFEYFMDGANLLNDLYSDEEITRELAVQLLYETAYNLEQIGY